MKSGSDHHSHSHTITPTNANQIRPLILVLGLNVLLIVVLVIAGARYHSLVLIAAATHQLTDAAGIGFSIAALAISLRPASLRHSYGFARLEVLAALINGMILIATTMWILWEAIGHLQHPTVSDGSAVSVVAVLGGIVSLAAAAIVQRSGGKSLAIRANMYHFMADSVSWIVTVFAGLVTQLTGFDRTDPIAAILISVLIVAATWNLITRTAEVLLEATPRSVNPQSVTEMILEQGDISAVHHLHIWSLGSEIPALSAHLVFGESTDLHSAQEKVDRIKELLSSRFGIEHATLETECHPCETPEHSLKG